ncbi:MAG: LysR substrate-binding domain-containing protein [Pseudarthrobacter sp.]
MRGELKGPVSLGCYTGLASNVLPVVLEGMASLNPKVEISITVGDHAELLRALELGNLDTAIVYDVGLPAGVERKVIYKTEVMAVLGANDSLAEEDDLDLADLSTKPLIMLDTAPSKLDPGFQRGQMTCNTALSSPRRPELCCYGLANLNDADCPGIGRHPHGILAAKWPAQRLGARATAIPR